MGQKINRYQLDLSFLEGYDSGCTIIWCGKTICGDCDKLKDSVESYCDLNKLPLIKCDDGDVLRQPLCVLNSELIKLKVKEVTVEPSLGYYELIKRRLDNIEGD